MLHYTRHLIYVIKGLALPTVCVGFDHSPWPLGPLKYLAHPSKSNPAFKGTHDARP